MRRCTEIFICAALLMVGAAVSYAQQDTLLVRPVSISIESGSIDIQADTVVFENVTVPKDNVTVPKDMVSEAVDWVRGICRPRTPVFLVSGKTGEGLEQACAESLFLK